MTQATDLRPTPRRRLTRDEARLQTRERLLAAAADVFRRQGYHGASLEAVADAAGYTKGAVYSNFATKADLFMALLERFLEGEAAVQSEQLAGGSIADFIDNLDKVFSRQVASDPTWVVLQIEFWLAAVRDPAVRESFLARAKQVQEASCDAWDRRLAEASVHSQFSGRELSILLNALASGLALQWELDPGAVDPQLIVRAGRVLAGLDSPAS
jgi:AcrR family transcriptional regulator